MVETPVSILWDLEKQKYLNNNTLHYLLDKHLCVCVCVFLEGG